MRTYESGTGRVTERIPVELTPAEAGALAEAAGVWERLFGDETVGPLIDGLRRVRKAHRIEAEDAA